MAGISSLCFRIRAIRGYTASSRDQDMVKGMPAVYLVGVLMAGGGGGGTHTFGVSGQGGGGFQQNRVAYLAGYHGGLVGGEGGKGGLRVSGANGTAVTAIKSAMLGRDDTPLSINGGVGGAVGSTVFPKDAYPQSSTGGHRLGNAADVAPGYISDPRGWGYVTYAGDSHYQGGFGSTQPGTAGENGKDAAAHPFVWLIG